MQIVQGTDGLLQVFFQAGKLAGKLLVLAGALDACQGGLTRWGSAPT
ncbi:MAG: hypothetical protein ACOYYS_11335 [Chloroflexota bacterium]